MNQVQITPGETSVIMFQLVDLDAPDKSMNRYIPDPAATISAKIPNLNSANIINKIPTSPFSLDKSIWQISLSASETSSMSGVNLEVTLTEGVNIRIARANSVIVVAPASPYSC